MKARNPSDSELWQACRKLPSDWEPHGQRKWQGKREARPDCDTCRWFAELFRTSPDWGTCANPESERAGLLTFREQGCWQHEPEKERRFQVIPSARCGFMRRFEAFLREQAADFIKAEVRRANDPSPGDEPPATAPEDIRQTPLFFVVRRLLEARRRGLQPPGFRQDGRKRKEGHPPLLGVRLLLLVEGAGAGHIRNRPPHKRLGA